MFSPYGPDVLSQLVRERFDGLKVLGLDFRLPEGLLRWAAKKLEGCTKGDMRLVN